MKKKSKPKKNGSLIVVNLKMTPEEFKRNRKKAKKHANGNLSAWLRAAGDKYVPKEKIKAIRVLKNVA